MSLLFEDVVYKIDDRIPSAQIVRPGEDFRVKLVNAFGKSFETIDEFETFLANDTEKKRLNHPCTGPIEVETDQKNISLAIKLIDMKTTRGYQCISKSTGVLKDAFSERECAIYEMDKEQVLHFKEQDLLMRGSPKLGFISTIDKEVRSCGRMCENGGNIDLNFLDKDSTIYLPVNHERARILVGDLHVCQGNGEAAGTGVEADGEVVLNIEVVDKIPFPVIDHKHNLVIVGWGETVDLALQKSVENTIAFFRRLFPFCDWPDGKIYQFISAEGNMTMGNSTGTIKTCGVVFFKKRLTNKHKFPVF